MLNKSVIFLILSLLFFTSLTAEDNSEASYLRMGVGARALAMGGAYTALANDATATYWNPAGLSFLPTIEIQGMYTSDLDWDRNYNFVSFGMPYKYGGIGIAWINAGVSDIQKYSSTGTSSGTSDYSDNAISGSVSLLITKNISVGITGKALLQDIADESYKGFGLDAGLIYDIAEQISIGTCFRNIAGEIGGEHIPYDVSFGVSVCPMKNLTFNSDIRGTQDDSHTKFYFGGEYWLKLSESSPDTRGFGLSAEEKDAWKKLFHKISAGIRAGINDGKLAGGIGIHYNFIGFDYTYVQAEQDVMSNNHRFSLTLRF